MTRQNPKPNFCPPPTLDGRITALENAVRDLETDLAMHDAKLDGVEASLVQRIDDLELTVRELITISTAVNSAVTGIVNYIQSANCGGIGGGNSGKGKSGRRLA